MKPPSTQPTCHLLRGRGTYTVTLTVQAQLIKTASSTVGTLAIVPTLSITGALNNQAGTFTFGNVFSGAASGTFANLAFTTTDLTVPLGQHHTSEFGGVGTTTAATLFHLNLSNCPPGMNSIKYELDAVTTFVAGRHSGCEFECDRCWPAVASSGFSDLQRHCER